MTGKILSTTVTVAVALSLSLEGSVTVIVTLCVPTVNGPLELKE